MLPMSIHEIGGAVPEWTISDRLRKAREASGLSQKELAAKASISLRTISNYENPDYDKERKRPFVVAWGLATGWSVEWLWTGVDPHGAGDDDPGGLEVSHRRWNGDATIFTLPTRNLATAA